MFHVYIVNRKQKKESNTSPFSKKNYSSDDLSAAVSEIKNGKLGTRRASSLYGIPRSTLRNKVIQFGENVYSLCPLSYPISNK